MLTYFISDIHLGAGYIADRRAHEARIVRWLEQIKPTAQRLFLVGDIIDYWYEYRYVVPRGYVRFFGALAALADAGCEIVWLTGNHDIWIYDYLPTEIGLKVVDGVYRTRIDGRNFLIEHGDGVGRIPRGYKLLRSVFRNRVCQKLYSALNPSWTIPFATSWSKSSRKALPVSTADDVAPDMERLLKFAREVNAKGEKVDYFVFGHLHVPAQIDIDGTGSRLVVLGEAYRRMSYGVWDGNTFELKKMTD